MPGVIPKNGDTVKLAGSVTQAEFGLRLCDNDVEMLEIEGKLWDLRLSPNAAGLKAVSDEREGKARR